jgi:sugar phosphate permease
MYGLGQCRALAFDTRSSAERQTSTADPGPSATRCGVTKRRNLRVASVSPTAPPEIALDSPAPKPLPALHRLLGRVFYGWAIAGALSGLSFIVVGVGFYGMAVFLDALCAERGWSRTSVSFATTLYFVTSGVSGSWIGRSVDRRGPRVWIAAGAVVMAVALLGVGRVTAPWQLLLVYPLLALGFAMTGSVPTSAIITRWFVARRALAMSVAQTGVSLGGIVLVPVLTSLILSRGLDFATRVLAVLLVAMVIPLTVFVLRADPREHGLLPDGGAGADASRGALHRAAQERIWSAREALRTRSFWLLVVAFGGILFCQVGTAMHQLSLLRERLDAPTAALAVSTTAAGSVVARLVVGSFADRVRQRLLAAGLMVLQACALGLFAVADAALPLFAASLVFGFTIGNLFMLQTLIVGELFGMRSFGTVLGLLQLITQTASGLGPLALGLLYAAFGGYPRGLLVLSLLALVSAATLLRVRPPAPPDPVAGEGFGAIERSRGAPGAPERDYRISAS